MLLIGTENVAISLLRREHESIVVVTKNGCMKTTQALATSTEARSIELNKTDFTCAREIWCYG